jgi:hypothetical protein
MTAVVWATLERYGIAHKVIAIVCDNASNNDTLIRALARKCHERGIPFVSSWARIRCMPHILHLAATEASHLLWIQIIGGSKLKINQILDSIDAMSRTKTPLAADMNYQDAVNACANRAEGLASEDDDVSLASMDFLALALNGSPINDVGAAVYKVRLSGPRVI